MGKLLHPAPYESKFLLTAQSPPLRFQFLNASLSLFMRTKMALRLRVEEAHLPAFPAHIQGQRFAVPAQMASLKHLDCYRPVPVVLRPVPRERNAVALTAARIEAPVFPTPNRS